MFLCRAPQTLRGAAARLLVCERRAADGAPPAVTARRRGARHPEERAEVADTRKPELRILFH